MYTVISTMPHPYSTHVPCAKVVITLGVTEQGNTAAVKAFRCNWTALLNDARSQFESTLLEPTDCSWHNKV